MCVMIMVYGCSDFVCHFTIPYIVWGAFLCNIVCTMINVPSSDMHISSSTLCLLCNCNAAHNYIKVT